jgi:tetratricopeptide (TPR) repeat protein
MNLLKTTTPILDEEITFAKCFVDMNAIEGDSYRFYISTLLLALGYSFMELRHFTSALDCFTECISMSENFSSDAYFRRSQVRFYNKKSKEEDLNLALIDINKAISINSKNNSKVYNIHLKNVLNEIKRYKDIENMRINSKLVFY